MPGSSIRIHRIEVVLLGGLVAAAGFGSEWFTATPWFSPHQVWVVVVGLVIAILGCVKPKTRAFRFGMGMLSTLLAVIFLELSATLFLRWNEDHAFKWENHWIEDDHLVYRLEPNTLDHDANGWRNPEALESASIVTLGDSQTWGWGKSVRREDSWPLTLARITGESVYNLSLPGYGPAEYYSLFKTEGIALKPTWAIVGLYFGNDVFDSASIVYSKPAYEAWRFDAYDPAAVLNSADVIVTTAEAGKSRWEPRMDASSFPSIWLIRTGIGRLLVQRGILSAFLLEETFQALPQDSPQRLDTCVFDRTRLYFDPRSRAEALNPEHLVVQEGDRLTRVFLEKMLADAREANVQLVVLLIPTKELVYRDYVEEQHGRLSEAYASLIQREEQTRIDYLDWFREAGITAVDGLIPLRQALAEGIAVYPPVDAHPNVTGYSTLARCIAEELSGAASTAE